MGGKSWNGSDAFFGARLKVVFLTIVMHGAVCIANRAATITIFSSQLRRMVHFHLKKPLSEIPRTGLWFRWQLPTLTRNRGAWTPHRTVDCETPNHPKPRRHWPISAKYGPKAAENDSKMRVHESSSVWSPTMPLWDASEACYSNAIVNFPTVDSKPHQQ